MEKILEKKEERPTRWLRSREVRKMLSISDSTLQVYRINGYLPAYRLGSSWFYKESEIIDALENNRLHKGG
jgi:predicted site-specific integrase-resolvase